MKRPLISQSVVLKQHYCDIHFMTSWDDSGAVVEAMLAVPLVDGYALDVYPEADQENGITSHHVRLQGESFPVVMDLAIDIELAIAAAGGSVITQ